jgi:uncharacterized protein YjbI with pentapeptide repeats
LFLIFLAFLSYGDLEEGCDSEGSDDGLFGGCQGSNSVSPPAIDPRCKGKEDDLEKVDAGCKDLQGADLSGADLSVRDLSGAKLYGANLDGTNLDGANLEGVDSGNIQGTPILPAGWMLVKGYLIGPGAILFEAALANADLSGANPQGADLRWANLSGADLSGADLTGVDLSYAELGGADLTDAELTDATLHYVHSGEIVGTPILPADWMLVQGYLIGPGAYLREALLSNADLGGANLEHAFLFWA